MKPILFAPTATEFDNNGLGALVDAPRCIVREERNGPYELEMDYPVDGQHFSEIELYNFGIYKGLYNPLSYNSLCEA